MGDNMSYFKLDFSKKVEMYKKYFFNDGKEQDRIPSRDLLNINSAFRPTTFMIFPDFKLDFKYTNKSFSFTPYIRPQTQIPFRTIDLSKVEATNAKETKSVKYNKKHGNFSLSKEFVDKTKKIAKELNCEFEDLLAVMNSESALNHKASNNNTAVGLIQFTSISLAELKRVYKINLTKDDVLKMSATEQLDLVEKYLKIAKSYKFKKSDKLSATDLYAIIFAPGRANQEVLYAANSRAARNNAGLNKDGGDITKNDLKAHLSKKYINYEVIA